MALSTQELKQIPLTAFLAVAAILLPQAFHMFGLGPVFLPMFLPVMLGGLLLTWRFALALAVIAPITSWLFTGMPPLVPPVLPIMLVELTVISLLLSILHVHKKKNLWFALLTAIVADRLLLFVLISWIAPWFGWHHPLFSISLVLSGIPGIVLQLVVLPLSVRLIRQKWTIYSDGES